MSAATSSTEVSLPFLFASCGVVRRSVLSLGLELSLTPVVYFDRSQIDRRPIIQRVIPVSNQPGQTSDQDACILRSQLSFIIRQHSSVRALLPAPWYFSRHHALVRVESW